MQLVHNHKEILFIIYNLFIFYLIGYSIYFLIFTITKILKMYHIQKKQKLKNKLNHEYYIPISILLKTHNDEKRIIRKVKSLLKLNYKLYEIIIIDNGSSDKTIEILKENFSFKKVEHPIHKKLKMTKIKEMYETDENDINITLICKEHNENKDILNTGINASNYPYFIYINADYTFTKNTLENLIRPTLENDKISVCIGNIIVGSLKKEKIYNFPKGILAKGQVTKYNNYTLDKNMEIPSLVLFKKDIVISSLEYNPNTIGENFEIINKIKKYCYSNNIEYIAENASHAISLLEVSNSISSFMKERKNWNKNLSVYTNKYNSIFSILKIIGILSIIISYFLHIIPINLTLLFFISYILFCSFLSLCNFISKLTFENINLKISNYIKVFLCTIIEQTILNFLLLIAKIPSFRKKRFKK